MTPVAYNRFYQREVGVPPKVQTIYVWDLHCRSCGVSRRVEYTERKLTASLAACPCEVGS